MNRVLYCGIVVLVAFLCSSPSEGEEFAGNLVSAEQERGVENNESMVHSSNQTDDDHSVHMVQPVADASSASTGSDMEGDQSNKKPKRASRPLKKAESVGFVPPAEKQEEEEIIEEVKELPKASMIPSLPPRYVLTVAMSHLLWNSYSIIKPGRMMNGSWYIVVSGSQSYQALYNFTVLCSCMHSGVFTARLPWENS